MKIAGAGEVIPRILKDAALGSDVSDVVDRESWRRQDLRPRGGDIARGSVEQTTILGRDDAGFDHMAKVGFRQDLTDR